MTEAWHLLPKCHTSECPLPMTPPRHGQAGRQWPLQRLGMMTARLALLKSVCEVLVNEAVRGAPSGESRIPGCTSVSGGPCSSSGAAEVQPGAGAALGTGRPCWTLLPVASSLAESFTHTQTTPGVPSNSGPCCLWPPAWQNLLPIPRPSRGFQQGLMSQQQWPLWPEGKRAEQRPSVRPSRCTYFQRSPDCKAGGQLLWELNQGASCPSRTQTH